MTSNEPRTTRRTVLCGAALAALGLTAAACGGSDDDGGGSDGSAAPDKSVELGASSAVPVGGAKLYPEQKLLVAQPEKGDFKAFSAVCTHQGSVLGEVVKGEAVCPLHGSRFAVDTGKVEKGPATKPLPSVPVKVSGGKLVAGPDK
ncbi:Rieske (2Fe-2S) protein [Streptomyces iconiensis]|uniref:Cytochrome bc1 complex Rieske iron-sulfur subunit n=1 Tax=Streptomyces iconiensis TaxID=1384038 RepID=A0ABT6ZVQ6_9ACTN|nr:Rieske (2Fe-2S) protein [Streptomyces iconiensis]MDJ1133155.1 Rieske (2Fe-2S) protein [Streptomyces iconiensis]